MDQLAVGNGWKRCTKKKWKRGNNARCVLFPIQLLTQFVFIWTIGVGKFTAYSRYFGDGKFIMSLKVRSCFSNLGF